MVPLSQGIGENPMAMDYLAGIKAAYSAIPVAAPHGFQFS